MVNNNRNNRNNKSGSMNRKGGNGFFRKRRGQKKEETENNLTVESKKEERKVVMSTTEREARKQRYVERYMESVHVHPEYKLCEKSSVGVTTMPLQDKVTGTCIGKGQCVIIYQTNKDFILVKANDGREVLTDIPGCVRVGMFRK